MDNNERETLHLLKKGSHIAFRHIYDLHKKRLANNLYTLLKSWDIVEEVLQEVFVKIWEGRERIDADKPIGPYLNKVGVNLVYDYFRKIAKDQKLAKQVWMNIELQESELSTNQVLTDQELIRIIELLPPQRKRVFKLCKLDGKSYLQASRILSISEAAVNDHITKANKFLLKHYDRSVILTIPLLYPITVLHFIATR